MEMKDLMEQVKDLVEAVRDAAPNDAVSFELFVNSDGHKFEFDVRTAGDLKANGISMRNLAGDFIK